MLKKDQITQELLSIITKDSTMEDIKDTLKLSMDSMKSKTLQSLLAADSEYQTCQQEYLQAYKEFLNTYFTESQRDVVDALLARMDERGFEYTTNAYMAGLLDGYRILKYFGLTQE